MNPVLLVYYEGRTKKKKEKRNKNEKAQYFFFAIVSTSDKNYLFRKQTYHYFLVNGNQRQKYWNFLKWHIFTKKKLQSKIEACITMHKVEK